MHAVLSERKAIELLHYYFQDPIHKKIVSANVNKFHDFRSGWNNYCSEFLWSLMQVSYGNIREHEYTNMEPDPLNEFIMRHYNESEFIVAASNTLITTTAEPIIEFGDNEILFLDTLEEYGLNSPNRIDDAYAVIESFSDILTLLLRDLYFLMGIDKLSVGFESFSLFLNTGSFSLLSLPFN